MSGKAFLPLTLVLALAAPAAPQDEPARLGFSDTASVSWVLVPVVAWRASGRRQAVRKLAADDFQLFVDERPVPIASFESGDDNPIRLIVLQDLSGSMASGGKLAASREALGLFLADSRPGDELALVTFASGETRLEVPFTGETPRLAAAMEAWQAYGTTALHDAVAFLPRIRAGDEALRRAAVLLSDGGDNASALSAHQARAGVRDAELPVYVLDLLFQRPPPAPTPPGEPLSVSHLLELLSITTGGRYHAVEDAETLRRACAAISAELREQYVLGFKTRETGPRSYHPIRLEVAGRKLRLRHRQGYAGRPPDDS